MLGIIHGDKHGDIWDTMVYFGDTITLFWGEIGGGRLSKLKTVYVFWRWMELDGFRA